MIHEIYDIYNYDICKGHPITFVFLYSVLFQTKIDSPKKGILYRF